MQAALCMRALQRGVRPQILPTRFIRLPGTRRAQRFRKTFQVPPEQFAIASAYSEPANEVAANFLLRPIVVAKPQDNELLRPKNRIVVVALVAASQIVDGQSVGYRTANENCTGLLGSTHLIACW